MLTLLRSALRTFRRDGFQAALQKARRRYNVRRQASLYRTWARRFSVVGERERQAIEASIGEFSYHPLISVVMPVYNVEEKWLRQALDSVAAQLYPTWELCIADDASPAVHIRKVLEEYAARDGRIKVAFRETNGNISAASNFALELVTGEFTALMDHDDVLAEDALFEVAKVINAAPNTDLIYSDEDKIDSDGQRFWPMFKPDWSPEMMRSMNLITHLCVFRTEIIRKIGGFREGFEGSQDYDLSLRFIEQIGDGTVRHVPKILYHWRAIPGSVALASSEKSYAHDRARLAISEHFQRLGVDAKVVQGVGELHRPIFKLPDPPPKVSVISGLKKADLDALLERSDYPKAEKMLVDLSGDARFEKLNEAARSSEGDILIFISQLAVGASAGWMRELVGRAIQPGIGPVGAKVVDTRDRIIHAGYLLGVKSGIGRAHFGYLSDRPGEYVRLAVDQNFSAVSAGFMAVSREAFDLAGGFDTENFPEHCADVALCLQLYGVGRRTVWTPWAKLVVRREEAGRHDPSEIELLKQKWPEYFEHDPFYNPNLSLDSESFDLAFPPRTGQFSR